MSIVERNHASPGTLPGTFCTRDKYRQEVGVIPPRREIVFLRFMTVSEARPKRNNNAREELCTQVTVRRRRDYGTSRYAVDRAFTTTIVITEIVTPLEV